MEENIDEIAVALDDDVSEQVELSLNPLAASLKERFDRAEKARQNDEQRWLRAYQNFRGVYGSDVQFTENEKSRVFVKVTKTKVLAAYGQIMDVLFANGRVPLTIEPTILPEGVEEIVHVDLDDPMGQGNEEDDPLVLGVGYDGDGNDLQPGETLLDRIGAYANRLFGKAKVKEGPADKPNSVQIEPAKLAAKKMEKKIHDQLDESGAPIHLRHTLFEMVLLGTGVIKGPFSYDKEYPRWTPEGIYDPIIKSVPRIEAVSVWNFYPDPDATSMKDADYVFQRHKMTRSQLRELRKRPFFREDKIEEVIQLGPNYTDKPWEQSLDDSGVRPETERFEVLEYWGTITSDEVDEWDMSIPKELEDAKEYQVNVWMCNDKILRLVLNPFTPRRIPYHAVPYELNPYNFFGVGLAENMEDAQSLMNGFTRMAVDNARLAGNMIIEIDETYLVPGQDFSVHPGKVFRRQGGPPGQAIYSTKWQSTANENMMMFDKARQLADEATGIPSISHGQGGVQGGPGRTAAGMSMFMGAAATNVKTVIRNVDDYLIGPLGQSLFAWNMQFDFDPEVKGDLEILARGTSSLMQREVKTQRLIQFMQTAANPFTASRVRWDALLREIAETLDIDPDKLIASPEEAALYMQLHGLGAAGGMMGAPGGAPAPADQTGGGGSNIGVGAVPMPGDQQFTGNPGGGNQQPPQVQNNPTMGGMQQ